MSDGGYSGTPLGRKLGITAGASVAVLHAPPDWDVPEVPDGVRIRHDLRVRPDVILAFYRRLEDLRREVGRLDRGVGTDGALWVLWPRRAAGHASDITEQATRDLLLPTGLVDVKVASVGGDWSGLRFVRRMSLR